MRHIGVRIYESPYEGEAPGLGVRASGREKGACGRRACTVGLAQKPGRNTILIVPQLVWGRWARRSVHQGHADRGVQPCRREFHSVVTGRDRLGCFNVPGVSAAAEPGAAPDRGRITVSRDNKLLQRPRQVSFGVRHFAPRARPPAAAEPAARSDGPTARSSAANPVRQIYPWISHEP
jgi:hypothetical protein